MTRATRGSAAGERMLEPLSADYRGAISRGITLTDTGGPSIQLHLESHLNVLVGINVEKTCGNGPLFCG